MLLTQMCTFISGFALYLYWSSFLLAPPSGNVKSTSACGQTPEVSSHDYSQWIRCWSEWMIVLTLMMKVVGGKKSFLSWKQSKPHTTDHEKGFSTTASPMIKSIEYLPDLCPKSAALPPTSYKMTSPESTSCHEVCAHFVWTTARKACCHWEFAGCSVFWWLLLLISFGHFSTLRCNTSFRITETFRTNPASSIQICRVSWQGVGTFGVASGLPSYKWSTERAQFFLSFFLRNLPSFFIYPNTIRVKRSSG